MTRELNEEIDRLKKGGAVTGATKHDSHAKIKVNGFQDALNEFQPKHIKIKAYRSRWSIR